MVRRRGMDQEKVIALTADVDIAGLDEAIQKIVVLTQKMQELKAELRELESCISGLKLEVQVHC